MAFLEERHVSLVPVTGPPTASQLSSSQTPKDFLLIPAGPLPQLSCQGCLPYSILPDTGLGVRVLYASVRTELPLGAGLEMTSHVRVTLH